MHKMKMDPNKVIDSDVYTFRSEETALSEATRITNKKTGATVKLTANVKATYKVMRYRYSYFSTEYQGYFDNQDDIAAGCGLGLSTIERILPELASVGLIDIEAITLAKDKRSNSYVVHNINPDDFLLERKDKNLGWVDCLEYPVFGSKRPQEPPKAEEQETEAVTQTSPQETQQPETNPALPSSDDIHTSADSGSDDSHDEQQTESPPDPGTEKIEKPDIVFEWGSSEAFKPNRDVTEPAKQWALSKTGGNVYQAERYLADYLSEVLKRKITLSFEDQTVLSYEDSEGIPF
ncbi:TPA: hypothetical protein M4161_004475 [Klebsiella pneumoniae]|nr:hypothetical protein [Klebsiella pneumoniae]